MSEAMTARSVYVPDGTWAGLEMVARLKHTSVSAELRAAGTEYLARYGLVVVDGQPVRIDDTWGWPESTAEEIHGGGQSTAEEGIHTGGGGARSMAGDPEGRR
jgi:hypothetical protein